MTDKKVEKSLTKKTDERPSFYHDAYKYIPHIDSKDFLLNDKYTHIFAKWWDDEESEER